MPRKRDGAVTCYPFGRYKKTVHFSVSPVSHRYLPTKQLEMDVGTSLVADLDKEMRDQVGTPRIGRFVPL